MSADASELPRDPRVERWLTEMGAEFSLPARVKVADIDVKASHDNQARLGEALLADKVEEYRLGMERGSQFPAVVLYQSGRKFVVIDGNNRLGARIARGDRTVEAYVVSNPSRDLVKVLTYTANVGHGVPLSATARTIHALELLNDGSNRTQEWVAKALHLSINTVRNAVALDRADQRAARVSDFHRKDWNALASSVRRRLGEIRTDEGFVALTKFVLASGATTDETSELVTELNKITSGRGQLAFVEDLTASAPWQKRINPSEEDEKQAAAQTPRRKNSYEKFLLLLTQIERVDPAAVAVGANMAGDREFAERLDGAAAILSDIANKTKRGKRRGGAA